MHLLMECSALCETGTAAFAQGMLLLQRSVQVARQPPHHAINLIRRHARAYYRMCLVQHLACQPACCPQALYLPRTPDRHCALTAGLLSCRMYFKAQRAELLRQSTV